MGSVARHEIEQKSARQRLAGAQAAQQGRPTGGHRPVGYESDGITIRPVEARLIRAGYRDLLNGSSLRSIARSWNLAEFRSTRGGRWRPDSVRDVLTRSRYAGIRSYRGEEVGPGQWKAVVDESTFRAATALLADPSRRTTPANRRRYMLSGLAHCGLCGALMDTGRTQRVKRTYKCSQLKHLAVSAEPIDELVGEVVVARLAQPDAVDLLAVADRPDIDELRTESQALAVRLDELADLYAAGSVTAAQLTRGTETLRGQLDGVRARMSDASRLDILGPLVGSSDVAAAWAKLDNDRRWLVVDALMTVTVMSPGRGARYFKPETVQIEWRY